jgi:aspartate aminotransferase
MSTLVYDGAKPTCIATFSKEVEARTITVAGFSKTYAMTGWRIGTTRGPGADRQGHRAELQSQMSSNVTTFAQYGALAALKEKEKAGRLVDDADRLRPPPEIPACRT